MPIQLDGSQRKNIPIIKKKKNILIIERFLKISNPQGVKCYPQRNREQATKAHLQHFTF